MKTSGVYRDEKNGTWYIHIKIKGPDGRFINVAKYGFIKKIDAASAIYELKEEAAERIGAKCDSRDFSLCIEKWSDYNKTRVAYHTYDNNCEVIRKYIEPNFGKKRVGDALSRESVESFRSMIAALPYTSKTKSKFIDVLRQIILFSVSMGMVPGRKAEELAPILERFPATGSDVVQPKRALTKEEYLAFMATFKEGDKYKLMFDLWFFTGLRRSELRGLQWDCIDFNTGKLYVHQQLQYSREEKKDLLIPPKTKKSVRYLDIGRSPYLMSELEARARMYGPKRTDFVFFGPKKAVSINPIVHQIKKHCALSGVEEFSPHEIRHTVASWLVGGCKTMSDRIVVQKWLGHSS